MSNAKSANYVTFSGGGWNSHTVNSAMIGALTQSAQARINGGETFGLSELFSDFEGASGNSGGSWFLSMLAYSPAFAADLLENPTDWFTTGYMGQQKIAFDPADQGKTPEALVKQSLSNHVRELPLFDKINSIPLVSEQEAASVTESFYGSLVDIAFRGLSEIPALDAPLELAAVLSGTLDPDGSLSWLNVNEEIVYSSYNMSATLSGLDGTRNAWSQDKSIMFPVSLQMDPIASYYDAGDEALFLTQATSTTPGRPTGDYIAPAKFIVSPNNETAPLLDFYSSEYQAEFIRQSVDGTQQVQTGKIRDSLESQVSLIDATSASSAFGGAAASENILLEVLQGGENWVQDQLVAKINELNAPELVKKFLVKIVDEAASAGEDVLSLFQEEWQRLNDSYLDIAAGVAVPLDLADGTVKAGGPVKDDSLSSIADPMTYRFLDGGYTDNTTVATSLATLQDKAGDALDTPFEIVSFGNSTDGAVTIPSAWTGAGELRINSDTRDLFGAGNNNEPQADFLGTYDSTNAAVPAVFDQSAWHGEKPVWESFDPDSNTHMAYYRLEVETIDNAFWDIRAGQKGVLHVFENRNTDSGPGPYFNNAFELYENIYDTSRAGVLAGGLDVHLLDAFGVMGFEWDTADAQTGQTLRTGGSGGVDAESLRFVGAEGIDTDVRLSLDSVASKEFAFVDIYKTSSDGTRHYEGSLGGSSHEASLGQITDSQRIGLVVGDELEFVARAGNGREDSLAINEYRQVDGGYEYNVVSDGDKGPLLSFNLNFLPVADSGSSDPSSSEALDPDDALIKLDDGEVVTWTLQAAAANTNVFSMVRVDRDETTGSITYQGLEEDTDAFDQAVRSAVTGDKYVSSITLNPFSEADVTWEGLSAGFYAPVLLTQSDDLFLLGHDLAEDSSHAYAIGENTMVFEDTRATQGGDLDFNDLIASYDTDMLV